MATATLLLMEVSYGVGLFVEMIAVRGLGRGVFVGSRSFAV
jgi:hypothetical protein